MILAPKLLADLRKLVTRLEDDLRLRCDEDAAVMKVVRDEYDRARAAERTAQAFPVWREDLLTQVAVAWVLSCVFVRFLEDNGGLDAPRLSGPPGAADRLRLARDAHTVYFRAHPTHSDREYLHDVFTEVRALPGLHDLFDPRHNPLWTVGLSADGATLLLGFWQKLDPDTGALLHDFTDPAASTRFLGDLYQDLSEKARKKYALLQTPEFVERFILDRTLTPAIEEFGFATVRLIDPTCGSGHFLLGAFERLLDCWLKNEPGTNPRVLVQRALDGVYGVDVNPFAVAIARFRLLHAALRASGLQRLRDAPDFKTHLAVGDSLLHGSRRATRGTQNDLYSAPLKHVYQTEDADALARILGQQYHAVVGNPPYITPKDPALNAAYRARFDSCHMKYALSVPFMERFFDLAISGQGQMGPRFRGGDERESG
jgi:hypothetical protein